MCDVSKSKEQRYELLVSECAVGLHDLCQPLTALQCRLEIGLMNNTQPALISAIQDALLECARMNVLVRSLKGKALQAESDIYGMSKTIQASPKY
jgi:hypothetical protein